MTTSNSARAVKPEPVKIVTSIATAPEERKESVLMGMLRLCAALTLLLTAIPASAYRREFAVTRDTERLTGSEVCFFRGGDPRNAFSLFFAPGPVTCLSADKVLDFPAGVFHVYARHADGYSSDQSDYFVYHGPPAPNKGYELLDIPVVPAGRIDFATHLPSLKPSQRIGVWVAPSAETSGAFIPLADGERSLLVPADHAVVPILVSGGLPEAVGEPLRVSRGGVTSAPRFTDADRHVLVAWTRLDRTGLSGAEKLGPPPTITLRGLEASRAPLFPIVESRGISHTLLFFRELPQGPLELVVAGDTWMNWERSVELRRDGVTNELEPLVVAPAAALDLVWGTDGNGIDGACDLSAYRSFPRPMIAISLKRCREANDANCEPALTKTVPYSDGHLRVSSLIPAVYEVNVKPPLAKAVSSMATAPSGLVTQHVVPLSTFSFFGRVRVNGQPVSARLVFASGEAASDNVGSYTAGLAANPRKNLIKVFVCGSDQPLTVVTDSEAEENRPFDIAVNRGDVRVSVTDAETGRSIDNATVSYAAVKSSDGPEPVAYYISEPVTAKGGSVKFDDISVDKPILFCAGAPLYVRRCSAPVEPERLDGGQVTVTLEAAGLRGTLVGHEGSGVLYVVNGAGNVLEEVAVAGDGSFEVSRRYEGDQYLVYVGVTRDLAVLELPPSGSTEESELRLPLPVGPSLSFEVRVTDMTASSGFVGLWMGGRYIPLDALALHSEYRGRDVRVQRGVALSIVGISARAPVYVAYAPEMEGPTFRDPFTLPQFAGIARTPVEGRSVTLSGR